MEAWAPQSALFLPLRVLMDAGYPGPWRVLQRLCASLLGSAGREARHFDYAYREHWLGHYSRFHFVYFHGMHHDALPCRVYDVRCTTYDVGRGM